MPKLSYAGNTLEIMVEANVSVEVRVRRLRVSGSGKSSRLTFDKKARTSDIHSDSFSSAFWLGGGRIHATCSRIPTFEFAVKWLITLITGSVIRTDVAKQI